MPGIMRQRGVIQVSDLVATYQLSGSFDPANGITDGLDALKDNHPAIYDNLEKITNMSDLNSNDRRSLSDVERAYLEHVFAFRKAIDKSNQNEMLVRHIVERQGKRYNNVKQLVDALCEEFKTGAPVYIVANRLCIGTSTLQRLKKRFPVVQKTYEKYRNRSSYFPRQTKSITDAEAKSIIELLSAGLSKTRVAQAMQMPYHYILQLCQTHPEFQKAYEDGHLQRRRRLAT